MVFRTSLLVDQKLSNIGLSMPYRLKRTCLETFVRAQQKLIFLNPEDRKSKVLAHQSMQHLLFHELGHIFVYKFVSRKLKKDTEFAALFGDLTKQYRRKLSKSRKHPDFISNYAQSHPEENFCEVFAVYCAHEGKIRKVYKHLKKQKKSAKVKKQAYWIHNFVKEIAN